jgi:hypothetical protein
MVSIVRDQLTFFDGLFTLIVVHSPIAWYIVWINIRKIYPWSRSLGKAIPFNPVLCFALVCGWISLNLVVWFNGRKFPRDNCGPMSFKVYLRDVFLPSLPIPIDASIPIVLFLGLVVGATYVVLLSQYKKVYRRLHMNRKAKFLLVRQ